MSDARNVRTLHYDIVPCALGELLVAASARGVCNVRFGDAAGELEAEFARDFGCDELRRDPPGVAAWAEALLRTLAGEGRELRPPLDLRGSRFERRVWDAICSIPRGETRSYGGLARQLGQPGAARALGRACGANPVALWVPCHRVVGTGGPGGYRWGMARKRALLALEGVSGLSLPGASVPSGGAAGPDREADAAAAGG